MELKIDKQFIDEAIQKAVEEIKQNGIIIPDGITNGELIQALFPNLELGEKVYNTRRYFLMGESIETFDFKTTDKWWNAPYKAESEE